MDKIRFSKTDSRRAVMALAVVIMFLATMGIGNVEAANSPVSITADKTSVDIMVGESTDIVLTLDSSDTRYRKMDVYMKSNWPSGAGWASKFMDTEYDQLPNDLIQIGKGQSTTVIFKVYCTGVCAAGDTEEVEVYAYTDPKWYDGGTGSGNDGGTSDTTPASGSSNVTTKVTISLTAATEFSSSITCDTVSSNGGIEVYQSDTVQWDYTLTNTGYSTDNYQFEVIVSSAIGASVDYWTVSAGLSDGYSLVGTSGTGTSVAEAGISISPATDARPGTFNIELVVTSNNGGAPSACNFDVVIPEPDLEIKNSDVSFSHNSAWINTNEKSQVVKIYSKVRNNGGTIDSSGAKTNDIVVKFYIDGAQLGGPETITSLAHGEEVTISREWQPTRAYNDDDEVGLSVVVKVDPSDDIDESDNDNNQGTQYFKVIRAKSSTPSFFIGFFALISAIAIAVMLSSYYRNKDLE